MTCRFGGFFLLGDVLLWRRSDSGSALSSLRRGAQTAATMVRAAIVDRPVRGLTLACVCWQATSAHIAGIPRSGKMLVRNL